MSPDCDETNCKLTLISTPVIKTSEIGLDTILGDYSTGHLMILHENEIGHKLIIEAQSSKTPDPYWHERIQNNWDLSDTGITNGFVTWNPIFHPYDTDAGHLVKILKENQQQIEQGLPNPDALKFTVAEGKEVCSKRSCILEKMGQIQDNRIGYYMLGPNSNSAAFSVLRACGFHREAHEAIFDFANNGRFHPGYNLWLLGWLANTRATRYQLLDNGGDILDPCLTFPHLCTYTP